MIPATAFPTHRPPFVPSHHYRPPNVDLMHMDPSNFYEYHPHEVKHRKRTTSAQLKILEGVFKHDTKPNQARRNELATQLDMTARGVQVWFQNRRAKEKNKAVKAAAASSKASSNDESSPSPPPLGSEEGTSEQSRADVLEDQSPQRVSPPQLHVDTDATSTLSWQTSPLVTPDSVLQAEPHLLRRGSLPGDFHTQSTEPAMSSPPLMGHLDPFARRCSVDASLSRLAHNPYAHLAIAKNGDPSRIPGRVSRVPPSRPYPPSRPPLNHVASLPPQQGTFHTRHASVDSRAFRFSPTSVPVSPSPSPLPMYMRGSLPEPNLYAFSTRTIASPIPGPLPSPNFSFGAASSTSSLTSPSDNEGSPNLSGYGFEDDRSTSYDGHSRFGSFASVGTTDTGYYSDFGSALDRDQYGDLRRRESCTSTTEYLGISMSNMDVGGLRHEPHITPIASGAYSPPEDMGTVIIPPGDGTSAYPSPSSTIGPGGNSPPLGNNDASSVPPGNLVQDASSSGSPFGHHSDPPTTAADITAASGDMYNFYPEHSSSEAAFPGGSGSAPDLGMYGYGQAGSEESSLQNHMHLHQHPHPHLAGLPAEYNLSF